MSRAIAAFAGLVLGFLPHGIGSASADEPAPLILFFGPTDATPRAADVRAALEVTARLRRTVVVDLSPAARGLAKAASYLRRGIAAYREFKYESALDHLQRGVSEASVTGANGLSTTELSDLFIYRGLVFEQRGDSTRSWDDFVRAAAIQPTRQLDPVRFSPRVIETFARATAAIRKGKPASLKIEGVADCKLLLDGRRVVGDEWLVVPRGEHYLRVGCTGRPVYGAQLLVHRKRQTHRPVVGQWTKPGDAKVLAAARQRGAKTIIWAYVIAAGGGTPTLSMRLMDVRTGRDKERVVVGIDGPGARSGVSAAADRLVQRVVKPTVVVGPAKPRPWYMRPWVWGVAGAAVATSVLLPFAVGSGSPSGFDLRGSYEGSR